MNRRSCDYYYKTCDLDEKNMKDKKRYELLNEYGYNFDSSYKRTISSDIQIKRCRNR